MEQLIGLAFAYLTGVVICVMVVRRLSYRWGFRWEAALMYFGVLPYPDEAGGRGRRAARRR